MFRCFLFFLVLLPFVSSQAEAIEEFEALDFWEWSEWDGIFRSIYQPDKCYYRIYNYEDYIGLRRTFRSEFNQCSLDPRKIAVFKWRTTAPHPHPDEQNWWKNASPEEMIMTKASQPCVVRSRGNTPDAKVFYYPLEMAVRYNPKVIHALIKKYKNNKPLLNRALMAALSFHSDPDVVQTLIKAGADVNKVTRVEYIANAYLPPLVYAAENTSDPAIIEVLIKAGADGQDGACYYARKNPALKGTSAYWKLCEPLFDDEIIP